MIHAGFHYRIEANITFTGEELWILFTSSREHYDGRCRAASRPSNGERGGEIWGLLNAFCDEPLEDETSEQMFERCCKANPTACVTRELPSRTLDLLTKICEPISPETPKKLSLYFDLRAAHRACHAEYLRMNPTRQ